MNRDIPVLKAEGINTPDLSVRANRKIYFDETPAEPYNYKPEESNFMALNNGNNSPNVQIHSFQEALTRGIGHYVICEFLVGQNQLNVREGVLREVGQNYFTLYDEIADTSISCDFYSLKFVTFYRSGIRPKNML